MYTQSFYGYYTGKRVLASTTSSELEAKFFCMPLLIATSTFFDSGENARLLVIGVPTFPVQGLKFCHCGQDGTYNSHVAE